MIGVTYQKSTGRWVARATEKHKTICLYSGCNRERAEGARRAWDHKHGGITKKCIDCPTQIPKRTNKLRCSTCAEIKRREQSKEWNAKKNQQVLIPDYSKAHDGCGWPISTI